LFAASFGKYGRFTDTSAPRHFGTGAEVSVSVGDFGTGAIDSCGKTF